MSVDSRRTLEAFLTLLVMESICSFTTSEVNAFFLFKINAGYLQLPLEPPVTAMFEAGGARFLPPIGEVVLEDVIVFEASLKTYSKARQF